MNKYVLGFFFDYSGKVILIKKEHPDWQKGRLNGVGGHIERGEIPHAAMVREFYEETGIKTCSWHEFVLVKGFKYQMHCFTSKCMGNYVPKNKTNEEVDWYDVADVLKGNDILDNLKWLIPMAKYKYRLSGTIVHENPTC
jgi:8-oxo-dGTP diphosphatase